MKIKHDLDIKLDHIHSRHLVLLYTILLTVLSAYTDNSGNSSRRSRPDLARGQHIFYAGHPGRGIMSLLASHAPPRPQETQLEPPHGRSYPAEARNGVSTMRPRSGAPQKSHIETSHK